MRRREFITLIGGAAATWPLAACAEQLPAVGFLHPASPETFEHIIIGFRRGLSDAGFVEGQNLAIEYRWARGEYERLPTLAADLVQRRVRVILAGGGEVGALAAKGATSTIPILIITSSDPVKSGLVASFNRPGGNYRFDDCHLHPRSKEVWPLVRDASKRSLDSNADQSELSTARRRLG